MLCKVSQIKTSSSFHLADWIICSVYGTLLGPLSELYDLLSERTKDT